MDQDVLFTDEIIQKMFWEESIAPLQTRPLYYCKLQNKKTLISENPGYARLIVATAVVVAAFSPSSIPPPVTTT